MSAQDLSRPPRFLQTTGVFTNATDFAERLGTWCHADCVPCVWRRDAWTGVCRMLGSCQFLTVSKTLFKAFNLPHRKYLNMFGTVCNVQRFCLVRGRLASRAFGALLLERRRQGSDRYCGWEGVGITSSCLKARRRRLGEGRRGDSFTFALMLTARARTAEWAWCLGSKGPFAPGSC